MVTALSEFSITGVQTTIPFHSALLQSEPFAKKDFSTDFLERTGIVEQMEKRAAETRQRLDEIGVALGAAILAKGVHRTVEFEAKGRGYERRLLPNAGEGRFFDQA
jgi:pyruvate carboxylase